MAFMQARSQQEIFGRARANYGEQNFFVYSDVNEGIKCLYRYICTLIQ